MENLFRFAIVRPPSAVPTDLALGLERKSKLQGELLDAAQSRQPRAAMKATAAKFAADTRMVRSTAELHWGAGFATMRASVDTVDVGQLREQIEAWFGLPPEKLVADVNFRDDDERAADSLIAIKLLPAEQHAAAVALADVLRHVSIVQRWVSGDGTLYAAGGLDRARARALVLPARLFPVPGGAVDRPLESTVSTAVSDLSGVRATVEQLQGALDELVSVDLSAIDGDGESAPVVATDGLDGMSTGVVARRGRLTPLLLRPAAAAALSDTTRAVVSTHRIDLEAIPLDRVAIQLANQLASASRALSVLEAKAAHRTRVGLIGGTPVAIAAAPAAPPVAYGPSAASLPTTHGSVRPVGVADLLVVKQHLKRYDARDIAHVENVLQGERKHREHMRSTVTEQLTLSEIERVREEEREHESTERFEMSRAATETIAQDASLSTGLTVSGSYGPMVDFQASVQGSLEQARERAVEAASRYSRDVTERSRTKVSETVRELRSLRIVNTVSEKNEHAIDNTAGTGHVRGVYQWLEKVYDAQVFSYGLRAMFDFTIPEPAAFTIHALQRGFADATHIERPLDFDITPALITESNYHRFVRDWAATGVSPPPEPFVTVTRTFRGGPDGHDAETRGMFIEASEVPLPDGYRAIAAVAVARWGHWNGDAEMSINLSVGRRTHSWPAQADTVWSTSLDGEVGSLGVAVRTWRPSSFTAVIEVTCQRTARALDTWRLATHAALLQAYQQQRSAYDEKLRALRARAGVEIAGKHPTQNRELERRELKKACISALTAQHFELFGAVEVGADGLPQLDLAETQLEGPYVRFFEQAFEWHNATYLFYPYFWARRTTWIDRFQYDDSDPLFAAFLRAGAARVVVPVRPGFELALDHFMTTGDVWQGGELPPVTSDTYVPIVQEIAEQLGAPGNEVPVGGSWEVSVPTSLVLLRGDGSLPHWRKDERGDWVPVES